MTSILSLYYNLYDVINKNCDLRTKNWFLMDSPLPTLIACLSYVYVMKILGPRLMANRKPFKLRGTLIIYNLFQVIFSSWIFYELGVSGWFTGRYSLSCQPVDYSFNPLPLRVARVSWWYFIAKFTEFLDTFFFVLRKKEQHISKLHIIHHGIMPMSVWIGVKFVPGGHATFFALLNSFIHILMYAYYLLSAFGPEMQKYLWWKKYLTTMQMIQFVAIVIHSFQLLFIECNFPKQFMWWIGMHGVLFYILFSEFYKQKYVESKERKDL